MIGPDSGGAAHPVLIAVGGGILRGKFHGTQQGKSRLAFAQARKRHHLLRLDVLLIQGDHGGSAGEQQCRQRGVGYPASSEVFGGNPGQPGDKRPQAIEAVLSAEVALDAGKATPSKKSPVAGTSGSARAELLRCLLWLDHASGALRARPCVCFIN